MVTLDDLWDFDNSWTESHGAARGRTMKAHRSATEVYITEKDRENTGAQHAIVPADKRQLRS
jgi:hypothetical protein